MLSLIDFPDPLDPAAPRLRHALADPAALWQAHTLQEVAPVLAAAEAAARAGAWVLGWVSYEAAPAWDADTIQAILRQRLVDELGIKPKFAFGPARVGVTGSRVSPPLFESMEILGRDSSLARLRALRAQL